MFQTDRGARLSETIAAFHAGDAEKWLDAGENIAGCNQLSEGDYQGTPIAAQVSQPAYPPMGDQSFSLRLTAAGPTATYVTDVVYVRIGDFIIQIGTNTIGAPDFDLLSGLEHKAILAFQAANF